MDQGLKQFVPSSTCLACEGCCRFSEENSSWRPCLTEDEKRNAVYTKDRQDDKGWLKTSSLNDGFVCSCLDEKNNACTVYEVRPFDCALYPFLLVDLDVGPCLAVHLNCPFVQEAWDSEGFSVHVEYLKEYFSRPQALALLRNNPSLFTDVSSCPTELEQLFTIAL